MAPLLVAAASAILVLVLGFLLAAVWELWNSRRWSHIPGPRPFGLFRFGDLGSSPHVKAAEYAHKYGPVYTLRLGWHHAVVVTDPVLVGTLLGPGSNGVQAKFSDLYSRLPFATPGRSPFLYTEDEAHWNNMRQNLKHPFSISNMRNLFPRVADCAKDLASFVEEAGEGEVLAMDELFREYSLSAMLNIMFDMGIDGKKYLKDLSRHMSNVHGGIAWPSKGSDASDGGGSSKWLGDFFQFMSRLIQSKPFSNDEAKKQLWAALAAVNGKTETGMSVEDLQAQVGFLFMAGFNSTAASLGWTLYHIASHPDVEARLAKELKDARIEAKWASGTLTYADVSGLQYLYHVILETMRVQPPNPTGTLRKVSKDIQIGKYMVPKGTVLWVPIFAVHRSSSNWDDPDTFEPSRWEEDNAAEGKRGGKRYIPFMSGPKNCLGQTLAMVEMKTALAVLLAKNSFRLAPGISRNGDNVAVFKRCLEIDGGLRMLASPRAKKIS